MNGSATPAVVLDGKRLSLEAIEAIAVGGAPVEVSAEARARVAAARACVERQFDAGAIIYGVTTGFGRMANVVYDSVGKDSFGESLDCLRPRGMMVLFGQSSGPIPPFDPAIRDGKLFGRGSSDTKGPMAAALWALREWAQSPARSRSRAEE